MTAKSYNKKSGYSKCIINAGEKFIAILNYISPLFNLAVRLWIASIFWKSGITKIANWDQTLFLFEYEYAVPLLPVALAAMMSTAAELACPVFLVLGLATRFAALPLFIMTVIIQYTVIAHDQHYYWMTALLFLIFYGAEKLSLDHILSRKRR
jgi:putative oxidoreductase